MTESAPTMPQARVRHAGPGRGVDALRGGAHRASAATGALLEPAPQHAAGAAPVPAAGAA